MSEPGHQQKEYNIDDIVDSHDYIINGKVLRDVAGYAKGSWVAGVVSRPYPSPAPESEPEPLPKPEINEKEFREIWNKYMAEHDARIAAEATAAERERVLKEALNKFSQIVYNGDCPRKHNCRDHTHCEVCQLEFVVESLRGQP